MIYRFFLIVMLVFSVSACANKTPDAVNASTSSVPGDSMPAANDRIAIAAADSFPEGKLVPTVICRADVSQQYALYIPKSGNGRSLPIVYLFDPHGNGVLPVDKYKGLAEVYGYILVGSNNSRNGNDWATTEGIWLRLSADTRSRLKINKDLVYTCGFSGGAKVASYIALRHSGIQGVIANGAGLPDETPAGNFPFSFTAVAGEGDMNMTELAAVNGALDHTSTRHRILFFDGKHEWAPEKTMDIGFAGWALEAMRDGVVEKEEAFIHSRGEEYKTRWESFYNHRQFIQAYRECEAAISYLGDLSSDAEWFRQRKSELAANSLYQDQIKVQDLMIQQEESIKAGYGSHFQQPDPGYWKPVIGDLQRKAGEKNAETPMNQRLLAYLSLAFYSISNHLINSGENTGARQFVDLYKMADPANSEAWYFSAVLDARGSDGAAAQRDLLKAVQNGFRDTVRMAEQPEFQTPGGRVDLDRVKAAM